MESMEQNEVSHTGPVVKYRNWVNDLSECERQAFLSSVFGILIIAGLVAAAMFAVYYFYIAGGAGILAVWLSR